MTDLANRDQALKLEWEKLIGDAEVEKVARAIYKARYPEYKPLMIDRFWRSYAGDASAVIEALRPTAIEYGRRAYALAESKEMLARLCNIPPSQP